MESSGSDTEIVVHSGKSQLGTAINFKQYVSTDNQKMITIIGEYHNFNFNCANNKDISQYCLERVKENTNCNILLEYSKYDDPKTIGSETINSTYKKLVKHKKKKHIFPVDFRTLFLKVEGQSNLYDIIWKEGDFTKDKILEDYINPFFKSSNKILKIDEEDYSFESYNNIYRYIINVIAPEFNFINDYLDTFDIGPLQKELRTTWNKVMDIGIMIHILKNNESDEYIVIAGDRHCQNLETMLNTYFHSQFRLVHSQTYSENKCIQLNGTYKIN